MVVQRSDYVLVLLRERALLSSVERVIASSRDTNQFDSVSEALGSYIGSYRIYVSLCCHRAELDRRNLLAAPPSPQPDLPTALGLRHRPPRLPGTDMASHWDPFPILEEPCRILHTACTSIKQIIT